MDAEQWISTRWVGDGAARASGIERVFDRLRGPNARPLVRKEARDASARRALLREAGLLARLEHPALRRVAAVADGPARSLAVLEHVDGRDLAAHLAERPDDALRCAVSLLGALVYLHGRSRVHGDLKPDNVLVERSGAVRLIDLGLVVPVGAQPLGGTGFFLPPEQESGASASVAGDLYSFGRTFEDAGARNVVACWPRALRDAIAACTRDDPARRPPSAEAIMATLGAPLHPLDRCGELSRATVDHAFGVAAAALDRQHGETVVVVAPAGSGRTRMARDLLRRALARREAIADLVLDRAETHDALDAMRGVLDARDAVDAVAQAARARIVTLVELDGSDDELGARLTPLLECSRELRTRACGAMVIVGAGPSDASRLRESGAQLTELVALDRTRVESMLREASARTDARSIDVVLEASGGRAGRVGRAAIALAERPEMSLDELGEIAAGRNHERRAAGLEEEATPREDEAEPRCAPP